MELPAQPTALVNLTDLANAIPASLSTMDTAQGAQPEDYGILPLTHASSYVEPTQCTTPLSSHVFAIQDLECTMETVKHVQLITSSPMDIVLPALFSQHITQPVNPVSAKPVIKSEPLEFVNLSAMLMKSSTLSLKIVNVFQIT